MKYFCIFWDIASCFHRIIWVDWKSVIFESVKIQWAFGDTDIRSVCCIYSISQPLCTRTCQLFHIWSYFWSCSWESQPSPTF